MNNFSAEYYKMFSASSRNNEEEQASIERDRQELQYFAESAITVFGELAEDNWFKFYYLTFFINLELFSCKYYWMTVITACNSVNVL